MKYMLALDQSTSGTKTLLVDEEGRIVEKSSIPHQQHYPFSGWAEQDAEEIWLNVLSLIRTLPAKAGIAWSDICGLSISNQRETTVVWDRRSGRPLAPAITWQCQRGAAICAGLSEHSESIRNRTGLALSAYYPASKAAWLLQNVSGLREKALAGEVCLGTIDSYLIFRLTEGVFVSDYSNASRTQLFNIRTLSWDKEIADLFDIPLQTLADTFPSDQVFGSTADGVLPVHLPIAGVLGDSHAALFGQGCVRPGMAKATYGTGSSIMLNVGPKFVAPPSGISASIAWGWNGIVDYCLEGNVTSSGDTLSWLCNELEFAQSPVEIDRLAEQIHSSEGVYLVPAFAGLGAPYFDSQARAAIVGLSRGSRKVHIARAALESIAYQNQKVIAAMNTSMSELRVDGGPSRSDVLMQFQADLLSCTVRCSVAQEVSALGAAFMGGLTLGLYSSLDQIPARLECGKIFEPILEPSAVTKMLQGWDQAVERVRSHQ